MTIVMRNKPLIDSFVSLYYCHNSSIKKKDIVLKWQFKTVDGITVGFKCRHLLGGKNALIMPAWMPAFFPLGSLKNVKLHFLPPNTTYLVQPLDMCDQESETFIESFWWRKYSLSRRISRCLPTLDRFSWIRCCCT